LREVKVFEAPAELGKEWKGVRQIVRLKSIVSGRKYKGNKPGPPKATEEIFFLISSREGLATFYLEGIRLHWAIESTLHYVKDVTMKEDASRIRTGSAPQNMSTIKSIVLNILRRDGHKNIAAAARKIAHDIPTLKTMIF
jgi:predicted transposase YbfD/YdcC